MAFATQKGGAGKSTLTTLVASYLRYVLGKKVLALDCAPDKKLLRNSYLPELVDEILATIDPD